MSRYLRRLEAVMEEFDCNRSEAVEIIKNEFAHEELPEEDEMDRIMQDYEDD